MNDTEDIHGLEPAKEDDPTERTLLGPPAAGNVVPPGGTARLLNAKTPPGLSLLNSPADATEKSVSSTPASNSSTGLEEVTEKSLHAGNSSTGLDEGTEKSLHGGNSSTGLDEVTEKSLHAGSSSTGLDEVTEKSLHAPAGPLSPVPVAELPSGEPGPEEQTEKSISAEVRDAPASLADESTEPSLALGGPLRHTLLPKAGSHTNLLAKGAETNFAALISADQETFIPDASLSPPVTAAPVPRYPDVPGYEILGTLGRGGMGVVYKAKHLGLRRLVALKMILHGDHASPTDLVRFRIEAESIARLQHTNIVQIYEIGELKGTPFFSLEYVDGGTLSRKIDGMPQPIGMSALMIETLARAMFFAHQRGVVHRDLKPSNVLLTQDNTPKVVDFGLAKKLDEVSEQTHSGAIMGTPSYMAPEQADGRTREIGPTTDIYALGGILFEMLTGRPPFRAEHPMETIAMVIEDDPVPPSRLNPKVPRDLETICLKCLQKDIAKRYATAQDLADDLRRFLDGNPIAARPVTRLERAFKWMRRRPALAAVYGLLLVVSILGSVGGIVTWLWFEADAAREVERQAKLKIEAALQSEALARAGERRAKEELERVSYVHDINLVSGLWNEGNVIRARKLVEGCTPRHRHWEWHYLKRLVHPELLTIRAENLDETLPIHVSPDGKRLLAIGRDQRVREWDAASGAPIESYLGDTPALCAVYSPDGKYLAVAATDHTVTLWEIAERRAARKLQGHTDAVVHLAFSPDSKRLASASKDQTAKIWDVVSGKSTLNLAKHDNLVSWVAFSPDGRRLASASWDSTAIIWDAQNGARLGRLGHDNDPLTQVAYAPDGTRLATCTGGNKVKLWDPNTFSELEPLEGPMEDVNHIAFSPDGSRLALAKKDKTTKVFDLQTGKKLFFLQGHTGEVTKAAFSPDGMFLVSAGQDQTLKVWDATTGHEPLSLPAGLDNLAYFAYSPTDPGQMAVAVSKEVKLWDTHTGSTRATLEGHADEINVLAYSTSGRRLATASKDQTVNLWDVQRGKLLFTLKGHASEVTALAFSADGTLLASGGFDKIVNVWDAARGVKLFSLEGFEGDIDQLAFTRDGRQLAACGKDKHVLVWEPATGKRLFVLAGHSDLVRSLAYNRDGSRLATAGKDGTAILWDAHTGHKLFTLLGHTSGILHLAFSPSDRYLATASMDNDVNLWDCADGRLLRTLTGHIGPVEHVVFSPDGERLATASWERTAKLWDFHTGKELPTLTGHAEELRTIAFSPDGKQLASLSRGSLKIWESQAAEGADTWKVRRQLWREHQAAAAEESGHWFAAAFHLEHLVRGAPDQAGWQRRLREARKMLAGGTQEQP